jgi:cold-inducible RNA-binding protein
MTGRYQWKERTMNIFVGNLASDVTDDDLRQAFGAYGQVSSASVIKDRDTGQSRGFGFVEMPNEKNLKGKNLRVSEARGKAGGRGGRQGGGGRRRDDD